MQTIKEIGSYAGIAAVVGLAVLAALYFSQARDVKRLREWAGRAPDRAPTPAIAPQRVVAQPIARPAPAPVPTPPGAPAAASAAGAAPAVASAGPPAPPAATPAAARGAEAANGEPASDDQDVTRLDTEEHRPDDAIEGEGALSEPELDGGDPDAEVGDEALAGDGIEDAAQGEDEYDPEAAGEQPVLDPESEEFSPEELWEGEEAAADPPVAASPPVPPRPIPGGTPPALPRRDPPPPRARTAIIPPYEESRPGAPQRRDGFLGSPRRAVAIVAASLLVLLVAGFGLVQLLGNSDAPKRAGAGTSSTSATGTTTKSGSGGSGIDPKSVTVAVLNGTTVPGLAAQVGDKIQAQGFKLGNVTNSSDQQRAESVILFAPGAEREAADVGRRMKIAQREAIDPQTQALAGDASVVVIAGQNFTR